MDLTAEIKTELSEKTTEDKREALTSLHQKGYDIKPYLEEMLACPDGVNCDPRDSGFKSTFFAGDKIWIYYLNIEKTSFFYQELPDETYKPWPK
ncbi:MAG: hypothetical protein ISS25_01180 [Nanoarchaeota archaeon]|nr:hypothetical protein [DPANN group archaeon]MBL7116427.1 hypothetical protein [Nanoarchaeota archaeon]